MSSFIDLLSKMGDRPPSPMGFGASTRKTGGPPSIALIGRLTVDALAADPELAGTDVDALLVDIGKATKKAIGTVSKAAGERIWGRSRQRADRRAARAAQRSRLRLHRPGAVDHVGRCLGRRRRWQVHPCRCGVGRGHRPCDPRPAYRWRCLRCR